MLLLELWALDIDILCSLARVFKVSKTQHNNRIFQLQLDGQNYTYFAWGFAVAWHSNVLGLAFLTYTFVWDHLFPCGTEIWGGCPSTNVKRQDQPIQKSVFCYCSVTELTCHHCLLNNSTLYLVYQILFIQAIKNYMSKFAWKENLDIFNMYSSILAIL
jgi:hypothetical protein